MRLILVPGHLCGDWLFAPQVAMLGARARITLADIGQDDTTGAMAERLLAGAPERFCLAGLSLGGMVAMEVMARAPERLAGVCLIATDPFAARPREIAWRTAERARVLRDGPGGFARRFTAKFFGHDAGLSARLGPEIAARMAAVPLAEHLAQSRALDARRDMEGVLRAAGAGPGLRLVAGEEDRVCPAFLHDGLAALPGARAEVVAGCGHIVSLERPEVVTAALADMLETAQGS